MFRLAGRGEGVAGVFFGVPMPKFRSVSCDGYEAVDCCEQCCEECPWESSALLDLQTQINYHLCGLCAVSSEIARMGPQKYPLIHCDLVETTLNLSQNYCQALL